MCRFLLIKYKESQKPGLILQEFARACEKSRTPDGDRQEDGWGICFKGQDGSWVLRKSIKPIWEEIDLLLNTPESHIFIVHARSSSFASQKGNIEFNQPFVDKRHAFVFNGYLKGVNFNPSPKGQIGSQKIWNWLRAYLKSMPPEKALSTLCRECLNRARSITALNLGVCDGLNIYGMCYYEANPEYYSLHYFETGDFSCLCSEKILSSEGKILKPGEIIIF